MRDAVLLSALHSRYSPRLNQESGFGDFFRDPHKLFGRPFSITSQIFAGGFDPCVSFSTICVLRKNGMLENT